MKAGLANRSFGIIAGSPEQFGAFIKEEPGKWATVVKESGMRIA